MEGSHRQLGTRFTDRLSGNNTDRFTDIDRRTAGQIASVAGGADAVFAFAGQNRTDLNLFDAGFFNHVNIVFGNQLTLLNQHFTGFRMNDIFLNGTAENTLADGNDDIAAVNDRTNDNAAFGTAILFGNNHILSNVYQTTGQITGVCGLQSGIGQTFTGTVGGVEVLKHRQTFFKVGDNRLFDNFARRFRHQTAHTGNLTHLRGRTAGAGVSHHVNRVDIAVFGLGNVFHHFVGHFVGTGCPDIDNLVVLFAFGNQTVLVLLFKFLNLFFGLGNQFLLGFRHDKVVLAERNAGLAGVLETERHQTVNEHNRFLLSAVAVDDIDNFADFLLFDQSIDKRERNVLVLRQNFRYHQTSRSGVNQTVFGFTVVVDVADAALDLAVQINRFGIQRQQHFVIIGKNRAFAFQTVGIIGQVINTQNHILSRHDNRLARGRRQNIVGGHHQNAGFQLGFHRQRNVNRHLVTVEVGVKSGTYQRMQMDGLTFDQNRLKSLNTQSVQGRRTVQENRMFADHFFQNVPNFRTFFFNHAFGRFDGRSMSVQFQLGVNERLEQFQRHLLRQTALLQSQFRTDGNNRTAGIVDALAEQVLTETSLFTLQHVGQRFQRTLVGTGNGTRTAAVVKQSVNRFLQHAFFVADDNVRRMQFKQTFQTVVAVDHAAVQIV